MSDTVAIKCNICEFDATEYVSDKGQFDLPLQVVICTNCGLSYLNPRWTKEKYLKFYKEEYDKYYRPNLAANDKVTDAASNPILNRIKQFNLYENNASHILDIGSGEGNNLKAIRQIYEEADLYAIEPSPDAQTMLKNDGVEILDHDVDGDWDRETRGKFDLIVMRHVLEHMMDPVASLRKIAASLTENGIFYVAVPNCLNPTSELESKWFRVVHTYYFNKYTLSNSLKKAGLQPVQIVEGDKYNRGEIFIFAKKANQLLELEISTTHYEEQRKVYLDKLKDDRSLFKVIKRKILGIIKN